MLKSFILSLDRRRRADTTRLALLAAVAGASLVGGCRLEMYDGSRIKPLEQSTFFADSQSARPFIEGTVPRDGRDIGAPDARLWDTTGSMVPGVAGADSARTAVVTTVQGGVSALGDGIGSGPDLLGTTGQPGSSERMSGGRVAGRQAQAAEIRSASVPFRVTRETLNRGRERFNVYCSPCHGRTGEGNGMIVQRGFPRPPSLHLERLRTAADGHFYDVITNGFGIMYSYASRVKPIDRWAIASYIRALQLSHDPRPQNLPAAPTDTLRGDTLRRGTIR